MPIFNGHVNDIPSDAKVTDATAATRDVKSPSLFDISRMDRAAAENAIATLELQSIPALVDTLEDDPQILRLIKIGDEIAKARGGSSTEIEVALNNALYARDQALGDKRAEDCRAERIVAMMEQKAAHEEVLKIDDIVERAKALAETIQFPHVTKRRMGDMWIPTPDNTDANKMKVLDALFDGCEDAPHLCSWRGRLVDHRGDIVDENYSVREYMAAFEAVELKRLKAKDIREVLREWALNRVQNDLNLRVKSCIPEWDGKPRIEGMLNRVFECRDTEFTRAMSKYLFLSLYARTTHEYVPAPIVISLIGTAGCGKSHWGKRLAQIIMQETRADSVQLDLDGDFVSFCRAITGTSIVASIGEMSGMTRGDLNKIKDRVTRDSDAFDYKFQGHVVVPRAWITLLDSNTVDGINRDDSGNRRFAPVIVGELEPLPDGTPQWRMDFRSTVDMDSQAFESDIWQCMAESRAWFAENGGVDGYKRMTRDASKMVFEFTWKQMKQGVGIVRDALVGPYIDEALIMCTANTRNGELWIDLADIRDAVKKVSGNHNIANDENKFGRSLTREMDMRGGVKGTRSAWRVTDTGEHDAAGKPVMKKLRSSVNSFRFAGVPNLEALSEALMRRKGIEPGGAADDELSTNGAVSGF
jgi:hypothetical protein